MCCCWNAGRGLGGPTVRLWKMRRLQQNLVGVLSWGRKRNSQRRIVSAAPICYCAFELWQAPVPPTEMAGRAYLTRLQ